MDNIPPRIVSRFPYYRNFILESCDVNDAIAELCRDYDSVLEEIEAIETNSKSMDESGGSHHELLKLANELEKELLERLGRVLTHDKGIKVSQ